MIINGNNKRKAGMSESREKCTLVHSNGLKFIVNLNQYELQRAGNDPQFANELIEKYYKLHASKHVSAAKKPAGPTISLSSAPIVEQQETSMEETVYDNDVNENIRDYLTEDDDELISLICTRAPLFDMRIPLRERSREIINNLWEEIISELNIKITVKQIQARWKNIWDSYMRARSNINKKIASGSSAEDKLRADSIKAKHKHYALLQFLDDTLAPRQTISNVTIDDQQDSSDSAFTSTSFTPSTSGTKRRRIDTLNAADESFFNKLDNLCTSSASKTQTLNATQHFCLRLAESLDKLPRNVKNRLEIEFLQKIADAEQLYCSYESNDN